MMPVIIQCRSISEGLAEGEAIISKQPFGFNHGVDLETGIIIEPGHELNGRSICGKIFIFPKAKGSTGGSCFLYQLGLYGKGPAAIINLNTEAIVAIGAILCGLPVVDRPESDIFQYVKDGDYVRVDAIKGLIVIEER